jgi:hypothetical protein
MTFFLEYSAPFVFKVSVFVVKNVSTVNYEGNLLWIKDMGVCRFFLIGQGRGKNILNVFG